MAAAPGTREPGFRSRGSPRAHPQLGHPGLLAWLQGEAEGMGAEGVLAGVRESVLERSHG